MLRLDPYGEPGLTLAERLVEHSPQHDRREAQPVSRLTLAPALHVTEHRALSPGLLLRLKWEEGKHSQAAEEKATYRPLIIGRIR